MENQPTVERKEKVLPKLDMNILEFREKEKNLNDLFDKTVEEFEKEHVVPMGGGDKRIAVYGGLRIYDLAGSRRTDGELYELRKNIIDKALGGNLTDDEFKNELIDELHKLKEHFAKGPFHYSYEG